MLTLFYGILAYHLLYLPPEKLPFTEEVETSIARHPELAQAFVLLAREKKLVGENELTQFEYFMMLHPDERFRILFDPRWCGFSIIRCRAQGLKKPEEVHGGLRPWPCKPLP